jgi:hypothetical protein
MTGVCVDEGRCVPNPGDPCRLRIARGGGVGLWGGVGTLVAAGRLEAIPEFLSWMSPGEDNSPWAR